MPVLATTDIKTVFEIVPPRRSSSGGAILCDCCRRTKAACEFEEDCFGICSECLGSDAVLVDVEAVILKEPGESPSSR